jgi:hypothetical protein
MTKKKKTLQQIINHFAKQFKLESFLDTTEVELMLKRNGHNKNLADVVAQKAVELSYGN